MENLVAREVKREEIPHHHWSIITPHIAAWTRKFFNTKARADKYLGRFYQGQMPKQITNPEELKS